VRFAVTALGALALALSAGTMAAEQPDAMARRVAACTACHGKEGRATNDGYFPRIAGKPASYLYNQLVNFREGRRSYAPMTYLIDNLSDAYLQEIAQHFASLELPYPPPQTRNASHELLERGRKLALHGDEAREIPACVHCHGKALTGMQPTVPGLLGLPRDYVNGQLGAWKAQQRRAAAPDCMATIAGRLAAADVEAISAWLSSQPVLVSAAPAPMTKAKLPLPCGSVPR
jgi:cytochrome c553